jgi:ribonuclease-3
VLELAVARTLYDRFPDYDEGQLAKLRSHVVSRASCAIVAAELGLGERLAAARPGADRDELGRLLANRNVLAAVLEATLASVYLEFGFIEVEPAIVEAFAGRIDYALTHRVDHKTELQEELARRGRSVTYSLLDAAGPAHERTFTVTALVDGERVGLGRGSSKKSAEQEAAREVLTLLFDGDAPPDPTDG